MVYSGLHTPFPAWCQTLLIEQKDTGHWFLRFLVMESPGPGDGNRSFAVWSCNLSQMELSTCSLLPSGQLWMSNPYPVYEMGMTIIYPVIIILR